MTPAYESNTKFCRMAGRGARSSELTYYPVQEPGTRLLEPGYPDSVVKVRVRQKIFGYI